MNSWEIILFGLANILIGYLVGNWLTIGRDKRKEFNVLVDPIRRKLLFEREYPFNCDSPSSITLKLISEKLPLWKRRGFDRAIENYNKSKGADNQNRDMMGGFAYKDTSLIAHAANDLLRYLKPK